MAGRSTLSRSAMKTVVRCQSQTCTVRNAAPQRNMLAGYSVRVDSGPARPIRPTAITLADGVYDMVKWVELAAQGMRHWRGLGRPPGGDEGGGTHATGVTGGYEQQEGQDARTAGAWSIPRFD